MSDYCVVVADGARARLFTLEEAEVPEMESSPRLVETEDIANPEKSLPNRDLYANDKTRNRTAGGNAHGYDDHRENHNEEETKRFARLLTERTSDVIRVHQVKKLILVAQTKLLGMLRGSMDAIEKSGVEVTEVGKDITKLSPEGLHDYLAKENLLPRRRRPGE